MKNIKEIYHVIDIWLAKFYRSIEIRPLTPEKILEANGTTTEEINRFQELNRQLILIENLICR